MTRQALQFQRIGLVGRYQTQGAHQALQHVIDFVQQLGAEVTLESETALKSEFTQYPSADLAEIGRTCDLALVVGGDGTMLGVGRQLAPFKVPLVGIHQGRLGFMADISLELLETRLLAILQGEYDEDVRNLIHARVMRQGECVFDALAMNDVVVHRGSTAGMVELMVEVNQRFVGRHRADGLIIATPTGATAYALSSGGPLLHPGIEGWVLVPIAPHTLSNRPIVLSDTSEVVIEIVAGKEAAVNFDMQSLASLQLHDRVLVNRSEHQVRFLHPRGWSYFDTLREKLHWNEEGV